MDGISKVQLEHLHEVVKEFTTDRTIIMASPGTVRNNGKNIFAVQTIIGHNPTQKLHQLMYRGISTGFREWLKKEIDRIENK